MAVPPRVPAGVIVPSPPRLVIQFMPVLGPAWNTAAPQHSVVMKLACVPPRVGLADTSLQISVHTEPCQCSPWRRTQGSRRATLIEPAILLLGPKPGVSNTRSSASKRGLLIHLLHMLLVTCTQNLDTKGTKLREGKLCNAFQKCEGEHTAVASPGKQKGVVILPEHSLRVITLDGFSCDPCFQRPACATVKFSALVLHCYTAEGPSQS
jgi:hypothetical protein